MMPGAGVVPSPTSMLALALSLVLAAPRFALAAGAVWPPPQRFSVSGEPLVLARGFGAIAPGRDLSASPRLTRAIQRFDALVSPPRTAARRSAAEATARSGSLSGLVSVDVEVLDLSESLNGDTDYSYSLKTSIACGMDDAPVYACRAVVNAASIYGAMYGLESFAQLVDIDRGVLTSSSIYIVDKPSHSWRGLLLDVGRRFAPVPLIQNTIDTMSAVKLNILHLHVSDMCRFGVESLLYPNLTSALEIGQPDAGYYSQKDIKELIAYGADRGVRIVPEFEMPGHALGLLPIASPGGLEFCSTCAYGPTGDGSSLTCKPSQLWGSPGTAKVLKEILGEMAALFTDEVFHIGADETFVKAGPSERCGPNSTAFLEKQVVDAVAYDFKKTPAGWEQVLFETGAATNNTIVYAYMNGASKITATGHKAVVANGSSLYFTVPAPGGPEGWAPLWYDIGFDVPADEQGLLLGGEMSMWTDTYCSPRECGAMPAYNTEKGDALYSRDQDAAYGQSLGGMIWPRGFVGAGAFWNRDATLHYSSDSFTADIWSLNDALAARGALVCPSNCSCDQMTACGKPYVSDLLV